MAGGKRQQIYHLPKEIHTSAKTYTILFKRNLPAKSIDASSFAHILSKQQIFSITVSCMVVPVCVSVYRNWIGLKSSDYRL